MKYALISEEQIKQIQDALQEIKDSKLLKEQPWSNWVKALATIQSLKPSEPVAWMEDSIELYVQDCPSNTYVIPLYRLDEVTK